MTTPTTTNTTLGTGVHQSGGLPTPTPVEGRVEGVVQVLILTAVAGMAGAASFTHVHDWTMHNSPAGTGNWFGWANAMVSELIPLAAGLEVRRRRRRHQPIGVYPIAVILAAVALSLAGQFAEAKPGLSGWLISAVPALGFLALVKLVLSGPTTTPATVPAPVVVPVVNEHQAVTTPPAANHDEPHRPTVHDGPPATIPVHLLPSARFALGQHEQATGRPITADELAARISVSPDVAGQLLGALDQPTPVPARINGTPYAGVRP